MPISSIDWYGSKKNMVKWILPYIANHNCYVEPFGGSAAILLAKEKSNIEVYNDINSQLVNFFLVLQDPVKRDIFYERACLTPYSREIFDECRLTINQGSDAIRAWKFFIVNRQSYNAHMKHPYWKKNITDQTSGYDRYESALRKIPAMVKRLISVHLENRNAFDVIKDYDRHETFIYLDPPYVPYTRQTMEFQHEMSIEQHEELIDIIKDCKSMILLSGYNNPIYEQLNWIRKDQSFVCQAIGRNKSCRGLGKNSLKDNKEYQRMESLWINPNLQEKLSHGKQITIDEIFS